MRRIRFTKILSAALILVIVGVSIGYTSPLEIHHKNPRYFKDESGKALYFAGSSTWYVLQENGHTADKKRIIDFLDWLKEWGHNYTRVWSFYFYLFNNMGPQNPFPYLRTGPENANDGMPRFDLTKINERYFERVEYFLEEADKRKLFCSIMLFGSGNAFKTDESFKNRVAWHPDNNINLGGESLKDGSDFYSMRPDLLALQEQHVRLVIDQLNHFDNFVWEIINEAELPVSEEWQYHFIRFVRDYEKTKPKQHLIIMSGGGNQANGSLEASPADIISPDNSFEDYKDGGPASYDKKIVINDTDHLWGFSRVAKAEVYRKWVWKTFLRGNHVVFMDDYDSFINGNTGQVNPDYDLVRKNLGDTVDYAMRFADLTLMVPDTKIASTRYALVNDGQEYLVYFPDDENESLQKQMTSSTGKNYFSKLWARLYSKPRTATRSFSVQMREGTYRREWFDPKDSNRVQDQLVCDEDGPVDFRIPQEMTGDVVVHMKRIDERG